MRRPIIAADEKRKATLLKNRLSARKSVEKKNMFITRLIEDNQNLLIKNKALEDIINHLREKLKRYSTYSIM